MFFSRPELEKRIAHFVKFGSPHDRAALLERFAAYRARDLRRLELINARESARGVAFFLGLPGWEVQLDPASLWFDLPEAAAKASPARRGSKRPAP